MNDEPLIYGAVTLSLLLTLLFGLAFLGEVEPKIQSGTAIVKEKYEEEGSTTYVKSGTVLVPIKHSDRYKVVLTQCKENKCVEDDIYVTKAQYDTLKIGDEIEYEK